MSEEQAVENTDREIYREREGDYYSDSIHVTEDGGIGFNVAGSVIVKPLRAWMELAAKQDTAMTDTPDTQALVAEMREAGEGRTKGPWRLDTEVHPKGISDPKQVRYFDQTHQAWSNLAYFHWSPKDARFAAYAGTNWNTIADTLEAQSTQLAEAQAEIERLREACVALVNIWDANTEDDEPHPAIDSDFVSDLWKDDVIETVRAALKNGPPQ